MSQLKAMFDQATLLRRTGKSDEALALMEQVAQRQPKHPQVAQAMAAMLMDARQFDRAIYFAQVAVAAAPRVAAMHQTLATVLAAADRLPEAEKAARAALALDSMSFGILNTLGIILARTDRQIEATEYFERAVALYPDRYEVAANFGRLMIDVGRVDEAARFTAKAIEALPHDVEIRSARAFILNYLSGHDPADTLAHHVELGRILTRRAERVADKLGPLVPHESESDRVLTLGYLSSDFSNHSVIHFVEHLIERHDRSRFRVNLYHTRDKIDAYTERCRSHADLYRQVSKLDDVSLTRQIREDRVDILVDLGGLTARNRAGVMALRGAPVQATYCGYCNTTGIPAIGHRIIDWITDPAGSEPLATERLTRLDRCFLCYRPARHATEPAFEPASDGSLVFGSFNAPAKISEATLDLWTAVVNAESRATLLIKGLGLETNAARNTLEKRLVARGIDRARFTIIGWTKTHPEHFDLYHRVRVALDTTPYTGTTTTCEALWMGVPVVTLLGSVHAARVSASLLTSIGHPEWIAQTPEDYVRIAIELAHDEPRLRSLRASLRPEFERSPLRDEEGHTRAFECTLLDIWRTRPSAEA